MTDVGVIIASILISFIGIPHGALDPVVARRIGIWKKISGLLFFLFSYVSLTVFVVYSWIKFPLFCLVIFLLISVVHFGRDWSEKNSLIGYAYGAFVLGAPAFFQPEEVERILQFLCLNEAVWIATLFLKICFIASVLFFVSIWRHILFRHFSELVFLLLIGVILNPIWYFVVFFCLFHSARHFRKEIKDFSSEATFGVFVCVVSLTIITFLSGLLIFFHFDIPGSFESRIFQILFIGLGALTVPHMLLMEFKRHRDILQ